MTKKALKRRNRKPSKRLTSTRTDFGDAESVGVFESRSPDAKQLTSISELEAFLASKDDKGGIDIRGRVIAQLGVFKDRRGEFNDESLSKIVALGNAKTTGLKSNFKHKSMSDDNLGKHLGRDFDLHKSTNSQGVLCVKSKHFVLDSMAMMPAPEGGGTSYGKYVAGLAISDPSAFSSSLTLATKAITQLDEDKKPLTDSEGRRLPDIWIPTFLNSIDVVSTGDAVDDFLSVADSEEKLLEQATSMFLQFFDAEEITPEVARERLDGFADKVILSAFEKEESNMSDDNEQLATLVETTKANTETLGKLAGGIEALVKTLTPPKETPPTEKPAELSRDEFITKATALCKAQGKPELLGDFLANKELTIDGVKDALLAANKKELELDSNNDDQGGKVIPGGDVTKQPWEKLTADQRKTRIAKMYQDDADVHEKLGVSLEDFEKDMLIELGFEGETCEMMSKVKKGAAIAGAMLLIALGLLCSGNSSTLLAVSALLPIGMAVSVNQLFGQGYPAGKIRRNLAGGAVIYNGTFTFLNAAGFISGQYSPGAKFGGIAFNFYDATGLADGERQGEAFHQGKMTVCGVAHTLTVADLETQVYATDNHTLTTSDANAVPVGILKGFTQDNDPEIYLQG